MTWSPRNRCEDDDLDDRDDTDQRIKESESKRSDKDDDRRRDDHHHSRPGGGKNDRQPYSSMTYTGFPVGIGFSAEFL